MADSECYRCQKYIRLDGYSPKISCTSCKLDIKLCFHPYLLSPCCETSVVFYDHIEVMAKSLPASHVPVSTLICSKCGQGNLFIICDRCKRVCKKHNLVSTEMLKIYLDNLCQDCNLSDEME